MKPHQTRRATATRRRCLAWIMARRLRQHALNTAQPGPLWLALIKDTPRAIAANWSQVAACCCMGAIMGSIFALAI